jgi:hypothetical protein
MEILRTHGNNVPPSVVMAVSFLAVGCVRSSVRYEIGNADGNRQAMENDLDQVRHHLQALERIVGSLGGMEVLDFDLQRICTW